MAIMFESESSWGEQAGFVTERDSSNNSKPEIGSFEICRQAIEELGRSLKELEGEKLVTGARLVMYGSSISEPARSPSDIDLLLIYDHVEAPYQGRGLWAGRGANPLSDFTLDLYHKISEMGGSYKLPIITSPGTTVAHPPHLSLTVMSRHEFLSLLDQDPDRNRTEILENIEDMKFRSEDNAKKLEDLVVILGLLYPEDDADKSLERNVELNQLNSSVFHDKSVAARFETLAAGNNQLSTVELKEFAKEIALEIASGMPYEQSKFLRASYESYFEGRNWIQTAVGNGAVLIKGENIVDQSRESVFQNVDDHYLQSVNRRLD